MFCSRSRPEDVSRKHADEVVVGRELRQPNGDVSCPARVRGTVMRLTNGCC